MSESNESNESNVRSSHPPESGFRIEIERPVGGGGPPWRYEGTAVARSGEHAIAVVVAADGSVRVEPGSAPSRMAPGIAAMVRTTWPGSAGSGEPPPQRIVRWHADR